jgi:hypothetical protein
MGRPVCEDCGRPGEFIGWGYSRLEAMAEYTKRTGLAPIGPHRGLADDMLDGWFEPCPICRGNGLVEAEGEQAWKDCPGCLGSRYLFKGTPQEFEEVRSRILRLFPKAASGPYRPSVGEDGGQKAAIDEDAKQQAELRRRGGDLGVEAARERLVPEAEIRCVFFTLAVRNEALKKKWPGGPRDFWKRYDTVHNEAVTTSCFPGPYWDEQVKPLVAKGLREQKDFVLFNAAKAVPMKDYEPFPLPAGWLAGYVYKAGVMVFMKN